jgi:hypothetical protein
VATNWVNDLVLNPGGTDPKGKWPQAEQVIYHMLRCAGWEWVWECDGNNGIALGAKANHVPDGNMQTPLVPNWTPTGLSIAKVTSEVHEGTQSLRVIGSGGGGDQVESDALTLRGYYDTTGGFSGTAPNMSFTKANGFMDWSERVIGRNITFSGADSPGNDGTFAITGVTSDDVVTYQNGSGVADPANAGLSWNTTMPMHIAMWVKKTGTDTWEVEVDPGSGSPVSVGTFGQTASSDWELLHFDATIVGPGGISIIIKPQTTSSETFYIDSIMAFQSCYEFTNDYEDYADGDSGAYIAQTASDEFESSNYSFVAGDVGKYLMIFSASGAADTRKTNTGAYKITGFNGAKAVLDLRSGSKSLVSQDGSVDTINWRMVDINKWSAQVGALDVVDNRNEIFPGYALQSPHASQWRYVSRNCFANTLGASLIWAAPENTDLDVMTGDFFRNGPSVQSGSYNKTLTEKNPATDSAAVTASDSLEDMNFIRGYYSSVDTQDARLVMMFDDGGGWLFVSYVHSTQEAHCASLVGFVGADAYHPGNESFVLLSPGAGSLIGGAISNFIQFFDDGAQSFYWGHWGVGMGPDGFPRRITTGQLGFGSSVSSTYVWEQANAQRNPFSNDEFLQPLLLERDPFGVEGSPSERSVTEGVYQGRANMNLMTVFGNRNGVGDSFAFSTPTVTLTDAAGLFTADMDGKEITITNSTTPANDGTFVLTYISSTQVSWSNASGVAEAFTGEWSVNMAEYLHIYSGLCIDWPGERLV